MEYLTFAPGQNIVGRSRIRFKDEEPVPAYTTRQVIFVDLSTREYNNVGTIGSSDSSKSQTSL